MFAKQNTAKSFVVGPILDANGAAKTDEVVGSFKVTKNGTEGSPNASSAIEHKHTGHYNYAADAGDFDTLGEVEFSLNSGTNAMAPVRFQVLPANVYDSLVSGSDYLQVDQVQWKGTAPDDLASGKVPSQVAAWNLAGVTTNITGNVSGSVGSVTGAVGSVTGNVGGNVTGSVGSIAGVSFPANFAALGINASGHVSRVVLVDTCTTNADMRGTDGAYTGTPDDAETVAAQVASDLATAHGNGSWLTADVSGLATTDGLNAVKLASDGLDAITATEPTGKPTTFVGWLMWLVQRFRRSRMTASQLEVLTEAGATVTTQTLSDDNTTQSIGAPQ